MNACCPLCSQVRPVFVEEGRLFFIDHTTRCGRRMTPCEASGWLVEDEELIR